MREDLEEVAKSSRNSQDGEKRPFNITVQAPVGDV